MSSKIAALIVLSFSIIACSPNPRKVTVSLDFDDARANQSLALPMLAEHDMKATFFVLSPRLEKGGEFLTINDALAIQNAGHEIGGHTLTHPHLPGLSREKQFEEICTDREALRKAGLVVNQFAYPFGEFDATSESVAASCGYESARAAHGLCEAPGGFALCDRAESLPPRDLFAVRTHNSISRARIPYRIRSLIADAHEHGGGWVQLIFHHICDACNDISITPNELQDFLTWLDDERRAGRVEVQTVSEALHSEHGQ